jgi:hypothetical protein
MDLRATMLRAMRAHLAEDSGYRSAFNSEEARQIAEDCAQQTLLTTTLCASRVVGLVALAFHAEGLPCSRGLYIVCKQHLLCAP